MSGDDASELERAIDTFLDRVDDLDAPWVLPSPGPLDISRSDFGDFEILQTIGRGAAGVVYEARQKSVPGRHVAIKVLRDAQMGARARQRFAREISAVGKLDHPAIVPVVAADLDGSPPWFAMKLVPGQSAGLVIERLRREGAAMRADEALVSGFGATSSVIPNSFIDCPYVDWVARVGLELAEAMSHAHESGVLHRDIKPWNLIITPEGRPFLIDFGLARESEDSGLTMTGAFVGTLAYSSLEQLRGEKLDEGTDIYSLGATLYELLELRRLVDAPTRAALIEKIEAEARPEFGPQTPADLRTILECAVSAHRRHRYSKASAMADDLRAYLAGKSIRAQPPSWGRKIGALARRRRKTVATILLVALLLGTRQIIVERNVSERLKRGDAAFATAELVHQAWREGERQIVEARRADRDADDMRRRLIILQADEQQATAEADAYFRHASELGGIRETARRRLADLHAFRLRASLRRFADVLDPDALRAVERKLKIADQDGRYAELLNRRGSAEFVTDPPGAKVVLVNHQGEEMYRGRSPFVRDDLEEGSWTALVTMEGFTSARLPFLVRRKACYENSRVLPPAKHHLTLPPNSEAPDPLSFGHGPRAWTFIPGGWTLVEDDPPLWIFFEEFFIQTDETTYADWLQFMTSPEFRSLRRPPALPLLPRDGETGFHIRFEGAGPPKIDRAYFGPDITPEERSAVPVHGLKREEMRIFVQSFPGAPRGWMYAVPTRDQLTRAARGADGRRFPWGDEFSWDRVLGYHSRNLVRRERWPMPLRKTTADVSPFGVRDLSGSVAEICDEDSEPVRDRVVIAGGSFASTSPEKMDVLSRREDANGILSDVGVRGVMRRIPSWARSVGGVGVPYSEDFERADATTLEAPWAEAVDWPPLPMRTRGPLEWVSLEEGRLHLRGGEGHGSRAAMALLPLIADTPIQQLRLEVRMRTRREISSMRGRGFQVSLVRSPLNKISWEWTLNWSDEIWMRRSELIRKRLEKSLLDTWVVIEVTFAKPKVELRIWPRDENRPSRPSMLGEPNPGPFSADLLRLRCGNLVGIDVAIDRIEMK